MFPGLGRIHCAPFSDEVLYQELHSKAAFWMQPDFYGIDITALHSAAVKEYFSQASARRGCLCRTAWTLGRSWPARSTWRTSPMWGTGALRCAVPCCTASSGRRPLL